MHNSGYDYLYMTQNRPDKSSDEDFMQDKTPYKINGCYMVVAISVCNRTFF